MGNGSKTIGILKTGEIHGSLLDKHGHYVEMFRDFLTRTDAEINVEGYSVVDGVFPESFKSCDGWLITGSRFGVYDDLPWMEPLKVFIREAIENDVPVVGICFGHQIMAEAMGGKVIKSELGWGVGVHSYKINKKAEWMDPKKDDVLIHAMHQDQVATLPKDSEALAQSEFCRYAAISYKDKALSFQGHPEFSREYERDLIFLRKDTIPKERAEKAIASLSQEVDNDTLSKWIVGFFSQKLTPP